MEPYSLSLKKIFIPYIIFDKNEEMIGLKPNTPTEAKKAAKEFLLRSRRWDDISNFGYWTNLIEKFGLSDV